MGICARRLKRRGRCSGGDGDGARKVLGLTVRTNSEPHCSQPWVMSSSSGASVVRVTDFIAIRCPQRGHGIMNVGKPDGGTLGRAMRRPHLFDATAEIDSIGLDDGVKCFCAAHTWARRRSLSELMIFSSNFKD